MITKALRYVDSVERRAEDEQRKQVILLKAAAHGNSSLCTLKLGQLDATVRICETLRPYPYG